MFSLSFCTHFQILLCLIQLVKEDEIAYKNGLRIHKQQDIDT